MRKLWLLLLMFGCGKAQPLKTAGQLLEGLVIKAPRELTKSFLGIKEDNDKDLQDRVTKLEQEIESINQVLNSLYSDINDYQGDLNVLQQLVALNQTKLTELETNLLVSELIDPCGDDPGEFDEIILKMSDGSFVAYFESGGNKRFLSVLLDGNYTTTDKQQCSFSISNGVLLD